MKLHDAIPLFKRFALYEKGMMPNTIKGINSYVMALSCNLKSQELNSINITHVREFLYERKHTRMWSNKTFRNARQYLKTFFDFCLREGFIDINPAEKIEKPKLPIRIPRSLTKQQVNTLLLHVDCYEWYSFLESKRNQAMIRTFLYTGVRLRELLQLRTSSINFDEYLISIKQGKGKKDRQIPIHRYLMPYLKAYLYEKKKLKNQSEFFFSSIRSDSPLTQNNLYAIIKKLRKVCKFHFTPHQLRHTFGKLSTEANLNIFKLQKIMGHSSVSTTQIYVSISTNNLRESFQKLDLL